MKKRNVDLNDRRSFIKGMGAAAAVPLLGVTKPVQASSITSWDKEVDVIVVGTGMAGFTAALFAHEAGANVVMLEKGPTIGGTTIRSGGVMFIPDNFLLRRAGITENKEEFLQFIVRVTYPANYHPDLPRFGASERAYAQLEAFFDNAAPTIAALEKMGAIKYTTFLDHEGKPFADNYLEMPENRAPRGRAVVCQLETTEEGRYYYANNGGLGVDLIQLLQAAANKRRIPILTRHQVSNLVVSDTGAVIGVVANTKKAELKIGARRGVVFGSGGFVHNRKLRELYLPGRVYGGCATPINQGDFLQMAGVAGAATANLESAWWLETLLEEVVDNSDIKTRIFVIPGDSSIMVNPNGVRFCNEKNQLCGRSQAHAIWDPVTASYPNLVGIMIWDQRTADLFPGVVGIPQKEGELPKYVIQGKNVAELETNLAARLKSVAEHTGDVALSDSFGTSLKETLGRYNRFAQSGKDSDFQRGDATADVSFHYYSGHSQVENPYPNELMYPISDKGPYFAALVVAASLDSNGGPRINPNAQVLNTQGEPIEGLYGAGNCIAGPAGRAFWGAGGTLGPATVFGKIAGSSAASAEVRDLAITRS